MSVKNLIKSALFLSLLVSSTAIFAQDQQMPKRTPEEMTQRQIAWMQGSLSLSDAQRQKVHDILLKYAQQQQQAMSNGQGPDRRDAMMNIQKARETDLKGVLTGDQFQKYQAHVQEMKQERMQQRGNGGMQPGGN